MGSEIQSERNKQAQDMRDLQDTYRKKRKSVAEEGEAELQKVRKETATKLQQESGSGAATVNHVRKTNQEKLSETKVIGEQQLTYEKKALAKQLQNTREQGSEQAEQIVQSAASKRAMLQKNLNELNKREADLRAREGDVTENMQQEQVARREQIQKAAQDEIAQVGKTARMKKEEVHAKTEAEIRQEVESARTAVKKQKEMYQQNMTKTAQLNKSQVVTQQEQHSKMSEAQRLEFNANLKNLKDRAGQAIQQESAEGSTRLAKTEEQNRTAFEAERDLGVKNLEETRKHYSGEIARVHKHGDAEVFRQNENHHKTINQLKQEEKMQVEQMRTTHEMSLKDEEALHKKQAQTSDVYFKQALLEQKKEYDSAFHKNLKAFTDQVRLQKEQYMASAVKEKREVMQDVAKYAEKSDDPFYRLTRAKSQVEETDTHYIVKAQVPEHERSNVRIAVKGDKVIVGGQRRFEDKVKDESGQIATNAYQTFREIIPLERPVREKHVKQVWADGILTLKIPKA